MPDSGQDHTTDGNDGFLVTTACFNALITCNKFRIKAKKQECLEEPVKEQNDRKVEQAAEKMVEHPKYGRGKVISETEDMIKVKFEDYGEKELLKAFSQLKTV